MSALSGKVAIVSGAAQGVGLALARRLASEGARVVAFDKSASINDVSDDNITVHQADVSSPDDMRKLVSETVEQFGGLDILINNAAVWKETPVDAPWEQAVADFDDIFNTNYRGLLILSRLCVPHLQARGGGDIVSVSCDDVLPVQRARTNPASTDVYNASKWAINGLTDAWAGYLEKDNIRVNALCIGPTDTPMMQASAGIASDGKAKALAPEEVAGLLMDLLADGRTGENIGAWAGQTVGLQERKPAHRTITG